MREKYVVALITFSLLTAQNYAHYLIVKNEGKDDFKLYFPNRSTSIKNIVTNVSFSIINGFIVNEILKRMK